MNPPCATTGSSCCTGWWRAEEQGSTSGCSTPSTGRASWPARWSEALRCDYPWACERFHRFVLDGMADNAERFRRTDVYYYPHVEPQPGDGKGLLAELSRHACLIVTDDFPAFMLPRMLEAAAKQSVVSMEAVDSNGLLPLNATDRVFPTAHAFRRFLQRELREHLAEFPKANPLARLQLPTLDRFPSSISKR